MKETFFPGSQDPSFIQGKAAVKAQMIFMLLVGVTHNVQVHKHNYKLHIN